LHTKKQIDVDQAWFWSEVWQAAEREASKDIREGRVHEFDNATEAIAFLHQQLATNPTDT
jgi:hypothetical protein